MKNKGLLTRQGLSALGGHKAVVPIVPTYIKAPEGLRSDHPKQGDQQLVLVPGPVSDLPKEGLGSEAKVQPGKGRPRRRSLPATSEPAAKRYTLILKIPPKLRDDLRALLGTSSPAAKRAVMIAFSTDIHREEAGSMPENLSDPLISWRIDLRLEEAVVAAICARVGSPCEPVSTTLARYVAAKLSTFVNEMAAREANSSAP